MSHGSTPEYFVVNEIPGLNQALRRLLLRHTAAGYSQIIPLKRRLSEGFASDILGVGREGCDETVPRGNDFATYKFLEFVSHFKEVLTSSSYNFGVLVVAIGDLPRENKICLSSPSIDRAKKRCEDSSKADLFRTLERLSSAEATLERLKESFKDLAEFFADPPSSRSDLRSLVTDKDHFVLVFFRMNSAAVARGAARSSSRRGKLEKGRTARHIGDGNNLQAALFSQNSKGDYVLTLMRDDDDEHDEIHRVDFLEDGKIVCAGLPNIHILPFAVQLDAGPANRAKEREEKRLRDEYERKKREGEERKRLAAEEEASRLQQEQISGKGQVDTGGSADAPPSPQSPQDPVSPTYQGAEAGPAEERVKPQPSLLSRLCCWCCCFCCCKEKPADEAKEPLVAADATCGGKLA